MNATDRVVTQLNARRIREGEYKARCPAHQGKSATSLSIKDAGDRVLLHCHANCALQDILDALGMKSSAELFDHCKGGHSNPEHERRRLAAKALLCWREQELKRTAEDLRRRDFLSRQVHDAVRSGAMREEDAWDSLAAAYCGYAELEYYFHRLLNEEPLTLWRERRVKGSHDAK